MGDLSPSPWAVLCTYSSRHMPPSSVWSRESCPEMCQDCRFLPTLCVGRSHMLGHMRHHLGGRKSYLGIWPSFCRYGFAQLYVGIVADMARHGLDFVEQEKTRVAEAVQNEQVC